MTVKHTQTDRQTLLQRELRCMFEYADICGNSRWFAAYFAVIPLLAVGEVFLIRSLNLLHRTNVWAAKHKCKC